MKSALRKGLKAAMPVSRSLWKQSMTERYAPAWPCPTCRGGKLRLKPETLHYAETAASRQRHHEESWHITDYETAFSAMLECGRCAQIVSCCGNGGLDQFENRDEEGEFTVSESHFFRVKFFSLPMRILDIPRRYPSAVKECLIRSFFVFFCDHRAAANHIRQCAEEVISHAGVPSANSKGNFVPLSKRIEEFSKIDAENAERVDALRYIGNFGSHPEKITMDNVCDAYDILEVTLEDLYVGHQRSVRDLVKRIIHDRRP